MLSINARLSIPDEEVELLPIRSQGAGGQNVNKVSSAVHLRFDIRASSLPFPVQERLLQYSDRRISKQGIIVIKAQTTRSQERNKELAIQRLCELINEATKTVSPRRPTRPSRAQRQRRLDEKKQRSRLKSTRRSSPMDE